MEKNRVPDLWIPRAAIAVVALAAAWLLRPFDLDPAVSLALGAACAVVAIFAEARLRGAGIDRVIGLSIGLGVGLVLAALCGSALGPLAALPWVGAAQLGVLLVCGYVGLTVGAAKGADLNLKSFEVFQPAREESTTAKLLDTSVIIDGRIADIAEAGFLDGALLIPQFVLWELQLVADSADSLKRNRGRRGLDILQRLQKLSNSPVRILENDYPQLKEVDQKLIELGKEIGAKIVTNDFNLNKLAGLHGVDVLNINELANTLKPVVLPGETMKVFILKEGKEYNQGVAYLDDGTMVVVDNARNQISQTIEITVTSVLQTTAGKMIFGRHGEAQADNPPPPGSERRRSSGSTRALPKVGQSQGK